MRAREPPISAPIRRPTRWGNTSRRCARRSTAFRNNSKLAGGPKMSHRTIQLSQVVAAILSLVVAAGCASEQKRAAQAQIDRARTAYQQAQTDPNVQTYAPLRLIDAEKALRAAEGAEDVGGRLHPGHKAGKKAGNASGTGPHR